MDLEAAIKSGIAEAIQALYSTEIAEVKLESTNKDFEGDYTFVVFPLLRLSKKKPEETAEEIGQWLMDNTQAIQAYNVVKGFLNLVVPAAVWPAFLEKEWNNKQFGNLTLGTGQKVMVEYSSPNTNKPLHLGHIRNNLLGFSVAEILNARDRKSVV